MDCTEDDLTMSLFRSIDEVVRLPMADTGKKSSSSEKKVDSTKKLVSQKSMPNAIANDIIHVEVAKTFTSSKSLTSMPIVKAEHDSRPGTPVSIRTDMRKSSKKKTAHIIWEPNTLLLDCAKNGELHRMIDILAMCQLGKYPNESTPLSPASSLAPARTPKEIYSPISTYVDINYHSAHTGITPLHMACAYGHMDVVKYLIEELLADVTVTDAEGWTPLHSIIAEIPDPVPLNVSANANTAKDVNDRLRFIAVLKYLLNVPAMDLKAETGDGDTVLEVVKENDDTGDIDQDIIEIIESALRSRGIELDRDHSSGSLTDDDTPAPVADQHIQQKSTDKKVSPVPQRKEVASPTRITPVLPRQTSPLSMSTTNTTRTSDEKLTTTASEPTKILELTRKITSLAVVKDMKSPTPAVVSVLNTGPQSSVQNYLVNAVSTLSVVDTTSTTVNDSTLKVISVSQPDRSIPVALSKSTQPQKSKPPVSNVGKFLATTSVPVSASFSNNPKPLQRTPSLNYMAAPVNLNSPAAIMPRNSAASFELASTPLARTPSLSSMSKPGNGVYTKKIFTEPRSTQKVSIFATPKVGVGVGPNAVPATGKNSPVRKE